MSTLKPLNDQPVELTLSFESVLKIVAALEAAKRSVGNAARHYRQHTTDESNSAYYTSNIQAQILQEEFDYLTDLQRTVTMMLDNVTDRYANKLAQQDKELQAANRHTTVVEEAVGAIVNKMITLENYSTSCEDGNSSKADIITTNL